MSHFQFADEQFIEIREIWRDINSQCKLLQEQTGCPDSEIVKMIDSAKSYWVKQELKKLFTHSVFPRSPLIL